VPAPRKTADRIPPLETIIADIAERHGGRMDAHEGGRAASGTAPPITADEERQAARFGRLERMGVPYREALLVLDEDPAGEAFRETVCIEHARVFLERADAGRRNVLVLAGNVGTGKTVASIYVADVARPPLRFGRTWGGRSGRFRQATELVNMGLYGKEEEREALSGAPVVVMDDVGSEYVDNAGVYLCFLDWLLDKRYGSAGYTVITTNLEADHFRQRYGERLYDRLRHRADWFDIGGDSLRGNVA
jgi:hypothetical protein